MAVAYLLALAIVFVGMATIFLRMAYGPPPGSLAEKKGTGPICTKHPPGRSGKLDLSFSPRREPLWSIAPVMSLGLAVLVLGVYVPPRLTDLLHQAAAVLGAK